MKVRSYRHMNMKQRLYMRRYGHLVKARDLAKILGCSEESAYYWKRKYAQRDTRRARQASISLETAKRMYEHGALEPDVRYKFSGKDTTTKRWEQWQVNEIKSRAGKEPLKDIAASVGKSVNACRQKSRRLGINPVEHTVRNLALRLDMPVVTVAGWIQYESGKTAGFRLRHHREGRFVVIHRDDAEWLLDHIEVAWCGDFEDHPGKLWEFEG